MQSAQVASPRPLGTFTKLLVRNAGADAEILEQCPRRDTEAVCALAGIRLFTVTYQLALFTFTGVRLAETSTPIILIVPIVSAFVAIFLMNIDGYTIMRAGWYANGVALLKMGGIDISGGRAAHIKAGIALALRVLLAFGMAQLTAIFVCILMFGHDTDARIDSDNARANAPIVAAATERIDGDVRRQQDAIKAEHTAIDAASAEAATLRKSEDDLAASEPRLREVQIEIAQLAAAHTKAEEELQEAETFALNEAAGIKGTANNSGQAGEGLRYRAASERVANAKARAAETSTSLDAARGRLEDLSKQFAARKESARQQIEKQLSDLAVSISAHKEQADALEKRLDAMKSSRDEAIHAAVLASPDYVPRKTGLLIQIAALRALANGNPEVAIVILLIEITSFGFELAGVLAKVTAFVPTSYAAYLARDTYMRSVTIVDEMARDLDKRANTTHGFELDQLVGLSMANDNRPRKTVPVDSPVAAALDELTDDPPPEPPKRPRGRPRKTPAA